MERNGLGLIEVLTQHLPLGTEEEHETPQDEMGPSTSRTQIGSVAL
jgi:hypothetical protein